MRDGRVIHAPGIHVRPEERHRTVRHLVRLEALENCLRVMQDDGRGMQVELGPRLDPAAFPRARCGTTRGTTAAPDTRPNSRWSGSQIDAAGGAEASAKSRLSKINVDI